MLNSRFLYSGIKPCSISILLTLLSSPVLMYRSDNQNSKLCSKCWKKLPANIRESPPVCLHAVPLTSPSLITITTNSFSEIKTVHKTWTQCNVTLKPTRRDHPRTHRQFTACLLVKKWLCRDVPDYKKLQAMGLMATPCQRNTNYSVS